MCRSLLMLILLLQNKSPVLWHCSLHVRKGIWLVKNPASAISEIPEAFKRPGLTWSYLSNTGCFSKNRKLLLRVGRCYCSLVVYCHSCWDWYFSSECCCPLGIVELTGTHIQTVHTSVHVVELDLSTRHCWINWHTRTDCTHKCACSWVGPIH